MRLLLDTQSLLWSLEASDTLSNEARKAIDDADNLVCVSVVSLWECAIKADWGELKLPGDFMRSLEPAGLELLEISMEHLETYGTLPHQHLDPFVRILLAQALVEQLILVTRDRTIQNHNVPVLVA